jgi:hypothetical protein
MQLTLLFTFKITKMEVDFQVVFIIRRKSLSSCVQNKMQQKKNHSIQLAIFITLRLSQPCILDSNSALPQKNTFSLQPFFVSHSTSLIRLRWSGKGSIDIVSRVYSWLSVPGYWPRALLFFVTYTHRVEVRGGLHE